MARNTETGATFVTTEGRVVQFDIIFDALGEAEETLNAKVPAEVRSGTSAYHQLRALQDLTRAVESLARSIPGVTEVEG